MIRNFVPVPLGEYGVLDAQHLMFSFSGKLRRVKFGGKEYFAKKHFNTPIDMDNVAALLSILMKRTNEQKAMDHLKLQVMLIEEIEQRREAYAQLIAERDKTVNRKRSAHMSSKSPAQKTTKINAAELRKQREELLSRRNLIKGHDFAALDGRRRFDLEIARVDSQLNERRKSTAPTRSL